MPIKVLLVDDSPTARLVLANIISSAPDMQLVGEATNGARAIRMVEELRPDVVLMDLIMPQMDGLEATREIMHLWPTPIVMISSGLDKNETTIAFEAVNAGAVSVLQKPGPPGNAAYTASVKEVLATLRIMSSVRVIRHLKPNGASARLPGVLEPVNVVNPGTCPEIVAIVSSTGGPQTLATIITALPPTFSLPVVIVQHITTDFVLPLVEWLGTVSKLPVRIAQAGECLVPGTVYFAPGGKHLQFASDHRVELADTPANVPHIPSGDVLLASVARRYSARAVGVVLTGMGSDGAKGLRAMYDAGAITIAQNEESCVVFGMPKEAIALGAARHTLPPGEIAKLLQQYTT
ncbi:chemotaxis-specific protein-glutamate methyltransferase CheB [Aggregatilinea lenta]|uniref:chemotaxis-specific protein-glutamate methyltransferase CheB n=1 Tax=Aggregatilinea lenta TaxID=913108 RepID=UPI000E5A41B2|nr:chemotaxis-specific protein-glutamate methyltransferase CheB [Aggregatilinea lenta]